MNCTLTWGPMLEAQTLRIPDTKLPRAPSCRSLGDHPCSSHPPLTWSEHRLRFLCQLTYPLLPLLHRWLGAPAPSPPPNSVGGAGSLVCFRGATPPEFPGTPVSCHQVLSWALEATGRSESRPWDTCLGLTGEILLLAEGL